MKNFLWCFVLLAGIAILTPAIAAAQSCQMYSYSDIWLDENGNAVALNYTDASACGAYTAYATVTLTMPSGYFQTALASAPCCAEAIAAAAASQESGDGNVLGSNEVDTSCGTLIGSGTFPFRIHWGHDYMWYDDPLPITGNRCSWSLADSVQCHSVCQTIVDPLEAPCYQGPGWFNSMLDIVPWIEIQVGSRILGAGLNGSIFEVKQGSSGPPGACSAIPAHWGSW